MTPSFIGRYAIVSPGVRPPISLASFPTASILLSRTETATTEGSLRTIPLPGTKTSTVVVPRSMPSLGEKEKAIRSGIVAQTASSYQLPASRNNASDIGFSWQLVADLRKSPTGWKLAATRNDLRFRYCSVFRRFENGFLLACASGVWFFGLISHQNFFEKLPASSQTFFR